MNLGVGARDGRYLPGSLCMPPNRDLTQPGVSFAPAAPMLYPDRGPALAVDEREC